MAQSPYIPDTGTRPALRHYTWLIPYSVRGLWELVRARITFANLKAKQIPARNRASKERAHAQPSEAELERIAYVLPRLSDRLPWRSDCLIQALAGQNWLNAKGAVSEIQIGVENPKDGQFGAHAWLMHDLRVITGGDIAQYDVILAESSQHSDS